MEKLLLKLDSINSKPENEIVKLAKSSGKKVVGFFCSYVPEEIITAADMVPYRMKAVGSTSTSLADAYYSHANCTFARNVMDMMLSGAYDFLDGLVVMNSCDHIRRYYDIIRYARPGFPEYLYFLQVPHKKGDIYLKRYHSMLLEFKASIENKFGLKISDEKLSSAIRLHNRKRQLLRNLYEMRRNDTVPFYQSELIRLLAAVSSVPIEDSIGLIEEFTAAVKNRNVSHDGDIRLILSGGCTEEAANIEMIEGLGGQIVGDYICLGSKSIDTDTAESGDPLQNLAERYLGHLSCPRMSNDYKSRHAFIAGSISKYKADAVILERLPFCMLFSGEAYSLKKESKKNNYPLLVIEREYGDRATGQIKTRVQAFFEGVKNKKARKI